MENENKEILDENIQISDEEIEEVAGGVLGINNYPCEICKKTVSKYNLVKYNGRNICKDCYDKLTNK